MLVLPIFNWILKHTQAHTRERDTMHFELTRLFPPFRRLLLELGRRWTEQGFLRQPDDIFFLTFDELQQMADAPRTKQELVATRRAEFKLSQQRGAVEERGQPPAVARGTAERNTRLGELDPNRGEASVYSQRDLVPSQLMPNLRRGRVLVKNWNEFEREGMSAGAKVQTAGVAETVTATIKTTGPFGEIAARLWDVSGTEQRLISRGVYRLTENQTGTISFQRFEYPSSLDERIQWRMSDIAIRFMRSIDFDDGLFNVEMMYDEDKDTIHIVEVNPRMCPQFADLMEKVNGINTYEIALDSAARRRRTVLSLRTASTAL